MKLKYFLLFLLINLNNSRNENIFINDKQEDALIEFCFNSLFEVTVTIDAYLTSLKGLLFYYVDDKPRQIIVYVQGMKVSEMSIKIGNGDAQLVVLKDFCRCKSKSCSHEKFNFQFLINNSFSVICNGNITVVNLVKHFNWNFDFPIYNFNGAMKGCIWLINFKKVKNKISTVFPNIEHLSGCFFYLKFGGKSIPLNKSWSTKKCIVQCLPGICNGGDCIETYHHKPICKCMKSFLNGEFCNQTLHSTSKVEKKFQFIILKISWYLKSGIIFRMVDGNKSLNIYESKENKIVLKYEIPEFELTKEIAINLNKTSARVLLLKLDGLELIVELINKSNEWSEFRFEINEDLSNFNFTAISFLNFDHSKGDVVYKSSIDDSDWNGVRIFSNYSNDLSSISKKEM